MPSSKSDAMYRTTSSDAGPSSASSKLWRLPMLRKRPSKFGKEDKPRIQWGLSASGSGDLDHSDSASQLRQTESNSMHEMQENSYRQLQALVQRMKTAPSGPNHVDSAYKEFEKMRESCSTLCYSILQDEVKPSRAISNATETSATPRRDSSIDSPRSPGATVFDQRSSFSGRSLTEVVTGSMLRPSPTNELWLGAIREWKSCLETLCESFRVSLADTYKSYSRDATPEMVELLFSSKKFRREAVHRMRNASVTRVLSADPQFFPRYEIRFRNYERVRKELIEIRHMLQSAESGISPSRDVQNHYVSPKGDAILEFANLGTESTHSDPVLRFRVSSHMLAETSPIFARMFSGHSESLHVHENEDITPQLPPPPTPYICEDGAEVKLYRMPQYEVNKLQSMEILMHAAHMHNELVPREVSFEQFVAIAECSLRFRSTSPLELVVEHRWLPQWMHRGADDMPDGLLVISYAFGLRQLFTRMSKSAILNLVDQQDLQSKPWPQKIKDKLWAVRCAKVAQIHSCCTDTIQEYIRSPARGHVTESESRITASELTNGLQTPAAPPAFATTITSSPRCPKGSHSCDAANLGWMMLIFNEMDLLPYIMQPAVLSHVPDRQEQSRSLAQMVDILRMMPSPASPIHRGGVCDPSPAFRTAIADIYNSVTGLTLHDISGKSHGWALSRNRMSEPQTLPVTGLDRMAAADDNYTVVTEFPDSVRLQVLSEIDDLDDLHAAAQINRGFYETYQSHELTLMRSILRADRIRNGSFAQPQRGGNSEEKMLKQESDKIKEEGPIENADGITLISEEDYAGVSDEDEDDDDSIDMGHDTATTSGNNTPTTNRPSVVLPEHMNGGTRLSQEELSPETPRQPSLSAPVPTRTSPTKPPETISVQIEEAPMTHEEAQRILWPDSATPDEPTVAAAIPSDESGHREKFLWGDMSFAEGLEDKTLLLAEDKQLRSEHEERVGLLKKASDRPGSSSGNSGNGGKSG